MTVAVRCSDHEMATVMAGVCDNDPDAMLRFWDMALPKVRGIMRSALRSAGFQVDEAQLDDMARSGVVGLLETAGSWRPDGGAKPWNWAAPRLRALAFESLGILADDIDALLTSCDGGESRAEHKELAGRLAARRAADDLARLGSAHDPSTTLDPAQSKDDRDGIEVLEDLARSRPEVVPFLATLVAAASRRHASVFVEVLMEEAGGNRRAAVTVAQTHQLTHANVRQIRGRVHRRMTAIPR